MEPGTGSLLREHRTRPRGRHSIFPEDEPKRTPATTRRLHSRACNAGEHIGALCDEIHRRQGEPGIRRILGVLSLAKEHGVDATEHACQAALEMGIADYRFVRRWIERHPLMPVSLRQVDPLIRELTHYRDHINRITGGIE